MLHNYFGRQVQQLGVFGAALDPVVTPSQRCFKVVADGFVKLGVLFVGDVFFGACPQRTGLVHRFPFVGEHHLARLVFFAFFPFFFAHQNGQRNVVGVFANDGLEFPPTQVFFGILAQVQDDVGAACWLGDGFHLEIAAAATGPALTFVGGQACTARFNNDFVRDDET